MTLGDMFGLDPPDNTTAFLKIGLLTTAPVGGDCCKSPPLILLEPCVKRTDCRLHPTESKAVRQDWGKGVCGNVTSHFYTITYSMVRNYRGWSVYQTNYSFVDWPFGVKDESGSNRIRVSIIGQLDTGNMSNSAMKYLGTLSESTDLIIHLGGLTSGDINSPAIDDFYDKFSQTAGLRKIPYLVVPSGTMASKYRTRFTMPGTDLIGFQTNIYDLMYRGVYILFMNWDFILTSNRSTYTKVLLWMEERLSEVYSRNDIVWSVVMSYSPIICPFKNLLKECSANAYYLKAFEDLLHKYDVDFFVTARIPIYTRGKPQIAAYTFLAKEWDDLEKDRNSYLHVNVGSSLDPEVVNIDQFGDIDHADTDAPLSGEFGRLKQYVFDESPLMLAEISDQLPFCLRVEFEGNRLNITSIQTRSGGMVDTWFGTKTKSANYSWIAIVTILLAAVGLRVGYEFLRSQIEQVADQQEDDDEYEVEFEMQEEAKTGGGPLTDLHQNSGFDETDELKSLDRIVVLAEPPIRPFTACELDEGAAPTEGNWRRRSKNQNVSTNSQTQASQQQPFD
jgi:hypothetical protein